MIKMKVTTIAEFENEDQFNHFISDITRSGKLDFKNDLETAYKTKVPVVVVTEKTQWGSKCTSTTEVIKE